MNADHLCSVHVLCLSTSCHTCYQHYTCMQTGSVKLASHLNTYGVLWLQLWTNSAAAVLIYVWALSEVQHDPSGLVMSACLNAKPPVHLAPKNHGIANLRLQWHTVCDRLSYVACSRCLTHRAAVTSLLHQSANLQTQCATVADECVQVVRYPWYATSLLNCCPSWLTWLRSAL